MISGKLCQMATYYFTYPKLYLIYLANTSALNVLWFPVLTWARFTYSAIVPSLNQHRFVRLVFRVVSERFEPSKHKTLTQSWVRWGHRLRRWTHLNPLLGQCLVSCANTRHWPDVGLRWGHRLRRWSHLNPALGQYLVFAGCAIIVMATGGFSCQRCVIPRDPASRRG